MSCKYGLVLEGGGMRGMFTNGVIDELMRASIEFDCLTGVSAGVLFGCNYKSRQPGRALRYNLRFAGRKDYMSWYSLFTTGDFVNKHFAFHVIPRELDPLDNDAYRANPMKFYTVCTDIVNGGPVYHEVPESDEEGFEWMRASSSLPAFAQPVHLGGYTLLDGGISDSIPLKFMHEKGYKKNIVVLTQPTAFRKSKFKISPLLKLVLPKYPKVAEMMSVRHLMYNEELDYIEASRQIGDTLVICPEKTLGIGRLEMNTKKMKAVYDQGAEKVRELLPQIKEWMKNEII